ncbi:MAG TPA: 6-carboxytetrahydropterin synthase [Ignavibacteriales bacterium]|nr:6-carboxytetrahydropterin synthase [Ignavibacteriales bacterium]
MIYLTRRETFSASHRLHNPELSDEENLKVYGKCSNPNGHGHNYIMEVVVAGDIDPKTGYVIDLKKLKTIILDNVVEKVDHKNLNVDVDFMKGIIPTTENLAIAVWKQLEGKNLSGQTLRS